ncbi:hypothetical protein BHM03_00004120 [Ensete ventricosum]|nr:hypothetical protein BHM03_00004120 [Ensete ventricosum]
MFLGVRQSLTLRATSYLNSASTGKWLVGRWLLGSLSMDRAVRLVNCLTFLSEKVGFVLPAKPYLLYRIPITVFTIELP